MELTHGVYRARTAADRTRRELFAEAIYRDTVVHPIGLEIARLAGRIEGEQLARGISIAFQDLLIGATALHIGFDVLTLNEKHFQMIPGLEVLSL